MYIVTRPFREGEVDHKPGDVVDAGLWPNTPLLEAQRYLRQVPDGATQKQPSAAGAKRST